MSQAPRLRQSNQRSIPKPQQSRDLVGQKGKAKYREKFWAAVCCLVAALSCVRTLWFGFVYDDHAQIIQNPQVHSWGSLGRLLATEVWSQLGAGHVGTYYRPLFSVWLFIFH